MTRIRSAAPWAALFLLVFLVGAISSHAAALAWIGVALACVVVHWRRRAEHVQDRDDVPRLSELSLLAGRPLKWAEKTAMKLNASDYIARYNLRLGFALANVVLGVWSLFQPVRAADPSVALQSRLFGIFFLAVIYGAEVRELYMSVREGRTRRTISRMALRDDGG